MAYRKHHASGGRVLIVDESDDTREVLQTVLARRGVQSVAAAGADEGLALAADADLVVLDLDTLQQRDPELCDRYDQQSRQRQQALLFLGSTPRRCPSPNQQQVAKPYHYAALIRTIEEMLKTRSAS